MKISISAVSKIPIYEQITNQIREQVLSGQLLAGAQLHSIRELARELKVGIITAKRAYDDLCEEGMLISRPGKGVFVAELDIKDVQNAHKDLILEQLQDIKHYADSIGMGQEELTALLKSLYL